MFRLLFFAPGRSCASRAGSTSLFAAKRQQIHTNTNTNNGFFFFFSSRTIRRAKPWLGRKSANARRKFSSGLFSPTIPGAGKAAAAAVSAVGLTGSVSYYYDELEKMINHVYISSERSTRIAITAATCFDDYRRVLGKEYESPEARAEAISACHQRCADRTYKVLEFCAGVYIKMGQHLSAMTYLLPPEWTKTFIPLQDRCPISSLESIREMVKQDTGLEIEDLFSDFDEQPIGIASLAQVHTATLRETGEKVAVKFQHPALAEFIPLDLKLTLLVFSAIDRFFPEYPTMWLYHEFDRSIFVELDFTQEAKNAIRTQEYFKDLKGLTALRIPNVISARPRILVMECMLFLLLVYM